MTAPEALFRPVMVLMSGRLLGFIAAFFIPIVLARVFDQNDFGTYKQLFLIHATLFGFAQLGMAESLYYFLPMESRRGGAYIVNALLLMGAAGSVCAMMLWWQRENVAALLNNPGLTPWLPYVGIYLLLILLGLVLEIVLTVRKHHVGASVSYAGSDLVRALLFVAPVLWVADLGWLMGGAVAFALIRLCVTLLYLTRSSAIELKTDSHHLRQHLAYALPFGLAGVIEVLQLNFHLYAVSYYFDAATFAIYAVGCLQVPLIDILMSSTSNVMMVNMRQKVTEDNRIAALAIWLDSVRKISLMLFPLVALLLLVAPVLIVILFGEAYRASVPVFMVWTTSTLLVCLLTDGVLRVFAQNRYLIFQNLLRLAIIVALIQFFITQMQLIGAVLVTTLAAAVIKVVALHRVKTLLSTTWSQVLPWRSQLYTALISGLAALPCLLLLNQVQQGALMTLFSVSALYSLTYAVLLLGPGPLSVEEKSQLRAWIASPFLRYRTDP
ncbi:MAG: oligosaccharide flippase family protein [Pseudohongiella sp.]|uniref:lipopolysaccharide biosynthesis protein n=1 Tax=Pseudohongiella sp. TaxID=1979412 RepID=UPI0034A0184D